MVELSGRIGRRLAVLLAATLMLAACGGKKDEKAETGPRATQTVSVQPAATVNLPRRVSATGNVAAWNEVVVGAETGGLTAVEVYVDEGAWVKQGQPLIKMNDDLLRAQIRQQEASVASARATLAQMDSALARARELKAKGFLAQAGLDTAVANQGTAAAQLQASQAALAETNTRLGQTTVRAPVGGFISSRSVVKGQIVGAGTELFRLVRDGRLELNAEVPETQLAMVRAGMPATIASDQLGEVTGRVRIVTPQVSTESRVGLARIALDSAGGFRPGMFARGVINVGEQPGVTVPQSAIVYRDNKPGVFVVQAQDVVRFRAVVTGARTKDALEISQGVNAGERIVVSGAGFLADGDHVRVAPAR